MQINIFENATLLEATKNMIDAIDNSDVFVDHIIVVPDKYSLQMEKLVFDRLKQDSFFNVRVASISNIVCEILEQNDVLSSEESLLITQKAIENVKDDLSVFAKLNINFTYEINKIISQFKSSIITPDKLNDKLNSLTGQKYHDLKLIYSEYERLRQTNDVSSRMFEASERLLSKEIYKTSNFYFAMFDAFTSEAYNLIKSLILSSSEVSFAVAKSIETGNEYIYENDIIEKLSQISNETNCFLKTIESCPKLSHQSMAITKGLFSYGNITCENNSFYQTFSCTSKEQEVALASKIIYNLITKGIKYKDIAVIVSDVEAYSDIIEEKFDKYNFAYYLDKSNTADKTLVSLLVFSFFECKLSGYSKESLLSIFSNIILRKNDELIKRVENFDIDSKSKYKKYIEKDFAFASILEGIENAKTAKDFSIVLKNLLSAIKENFDNISAALEEKKYLKEKSLFVQVYDILDDVFDLIEKYENEISAKDYYQRLKLILSFKQVSSVPSFVDGIIVADASNSGLLGIKNLIILGGNELPCTKSDSSFFSDYDLSLNLFAIEPTVRMINRRNRFKLFSLLTQAEDSLIVFQNKTRGGKYTPAFIESLNKIFGAEEVKGEDVENIVPYLMFGNRTNFAEEYQNLLEEQTIFKNDSTSLEGSKQLFQNKKSFSLSELEQYFSCPFKHFARYGLGLKEKEEFKFTPADMGNLCHKFAEIFLSNYMKNGKFDNIQDFIEKHFESIIKSEKIFDKLSFHSEKEILTNYLKHVLQSFLDDIVFEINSSNFKPSKLEQSFDGLFGNNKKVKLVGRADRIDECENYFRIIDYKTGTTDNLLKQLYFGSKLQLFLYSKFARETFGKDCAGVFYFNAKFDFESDTNKQEKLLKGLCKNDSDSLKLFDKNLQEKVGSKLLSISLGSDGQIKGNAVAKDSFEKYEQYACKISNQAVDEILDGFIAAKPNSDSCKYCPYIFLCKYESLQGQRQNKNYGDFNA